MQETTLNELRLKQISFQERASRLRAKQSHTVATAPKAAALGRAVRDAQRRADDYQKILSMLENPSVERDYYALCERVLNHTELMRIVQAGEGKHPQDLVGRLIQYLTNSDSN